VERPYAARSPLRRVCRSGGKGRTKAAVIAELAVRTKELQDHRKETIVLKSHKRGSRGQMVTFPPWKTPAPKDRHCPRKIVSRTTENNLGFNLDWLRDWIPDNSNMVYRNEVTLDELQQICWWVRGYMLIQRRMQQEAKVAYVMYRIGPRVAGKVST
jgi:hypothetical protein